MLTLCAGDWRGCYKGQYDLWTAESMAHPAKMAPGLVFRILAHLKERGLLKDGGAVLDPMGGVGTTALAAVSLGYRAVTVELEAAFIAHEKANLARLETKLGRELPWQILQGDARKLSALLSEDGMTARARWSRARLEALAVGMASSPITSPPYGEAQSGGGIVKTGYKDTGDMVAQRTGYMAEKHGDTPGQIGSMPDKPVVVTSPPYDGEKGHAGNDDAGIRSEKGLNAAYGRSDGQLGPLAGETYLDAMRQVYAEIGKVAGVIAVVVKDPTRDKKLRLLGQDTVRLLEETGWDILCWHHAILFEEQEQAQLFGEPTKTLKGRVSFFKRLQHRAGAPVAEFEHVLIARRAEG